MELTTIKMEAATVKEFRAAAKSQGFLWQSKLTEIMNAYTRSVKQDKIKRNIRSGAK